MSEFTTTARPYANAVYQVASETKTEQSWSEALELMSAVVANKDIVSMLDNPRLKKEQKGELFLKIIGDKLNDQQRNLVRLMAENSRLKIMSEVAEQFDVYRTTAEGKIDAVAVSAFPLTKAQESAITKSLKDKLGREVTLTTSTDESLIGGVVIKAGDTIIDGSIKAQLAMLAYALGR
jgi:F-type H+-transporting ATPase subunit delta